MDTPRASVEFDRQEIALLLDLLNHPQLALPLRIARTALGVQEKLAAGFATLPAEPAK